MTNIIPPKKNKSNNPINQSERDMRNISPEERALESENDNIQENSLIQCHDLFLLNSV